MSTPNLSKTERIDVRVSTPVKQLLQEAARACHKNVSEFLLDAGVTAAAQTLADRRQFVLDDTQWQAFQEAVDRPVQSKPRLKKLLREPGVLGCNDYSPVRKLAATDQVDAFDCDFVITRCNSKRTSHSWTCLPNLDGALMPIRLYERDLPSAP